MTDILTLAGSLRALPDTALETLLTERRVVAQPRVQDFFDLAELLLDPASIRGALKRLDRQTLAVLAAAVSEALSPADLAARIEALGATDVDPDDVALRAGLLADRALLSRVDGRYVAIDAVESVLDGWSTPDLP